MAKRMPWRTDQDRSRRDLDGAAASATGNWRINRMAGTSRAFPQPHRAVCPAWLISTGTDFPQEHGSRYFMAISLVRTWKREGKGRPR